MKSILLLSIFLTVSTGCKASIQGEDHRMNIKEMLQGEWVYDSNERIIIEGDSFKIKYRNYYLSETTFSISDNGNVSFADTSITELGAHTGEIQSLHMEGDKIFLNILYDWGGEREKDYRKTDKPEFYYFDFIGDELSTELSGTWADGETKLVIEGNKITSYMGNEKIDDASFTVVRENQTSNHRVYLANENLYDPSLLGFAWPEYKDGILYVTIPVFDGNSVYMEFSKEE